MAEDATNLIVLREFAAASATGLFGFMLGLLRLRYNRKTQNELNVQKEKEQAETDRKDQIDSDTARADSMTRRFVSLMDGYENRIKDLTEEVMALRDEVKNLRKALDMQMRKAFRKDTDPDASPTSAATAG